MILLILRCYLLLLIGQEFDAPAVSDPLIEELQSLESHPIDINKAKKEDFLKIYWVSPGLAESIIKTRKEVGSFDKIEDLRKVQGVTDELLECIRPYITVKLQRQQILEVRPQIELRSRVQQTFPKVKGNWPGSPIKSYQRLKLSSKNISGFALLEKDPYEASYSDFATYGIMVQALPMAQKIILGDYRLEFGEGLLFGFPPIVTFKQQGVIKGKERGLQLYTITGENTYLHGVAVESKSYRGIKNFVILSNTKIDNGGGVSQYAPTIYDYEGDHSTESGEAKKDRVREWLIGTRFEYHGPIKLGLTWYKNTHFLNPEEVRPQGTKIGTHSLWSVSSSTSLAGFEVLPLNWFSEFGWCDKSWATVLGTEYGKEKLRLGTLFRYYPPDFPVFHSAPFSDSYKLAEKGNYLYGAYQISKYTKLTGYTDYCTRYSTELPTLHAEHSIELQHKFTPHFWLTSRYSFKKVEVSPRGESECKWFRLQADIEAAKLNMRVRLDRGYEAGSQEVRPQGELLYGDIGVKFSKYLSFTTRLILFDSELDKFGLYEYEQDLPGLMTNQFISDKGTRLYLLLKNRIASSYTVTVKYAITSKIAKPVTQKYGIQFDLEH
ncbi:MAG: helix-hairpin-helix domain-containing protein [bacterium]|nr:helix-hairpin-helix domain-containing protein [bacterium]